MVMVWIHHACQRGAMTIGHDTAEFALLAFSITTVFRDCGVALWCHHAHAALFTVSRRFMASTWAPLLAGNIAHSTTQRRRASIPNEVHQRRDRLLDHCRGKVPHRISRRSDRFDARLQFRISREAFANNHSSQSRAER